MCAGDVRSASRDKWLLRCDGDGCYSPIRSPHAPEMTPAVPVTRSAGETAGGLLHESFGHLRYIRLKKIGRTRRRPLEGARTRHQRAAAMPVCCRWLGRVWCTATDPGMFSVRHTCRLRHTMCATCIRTRPWLPDDIGQLRHYFDAHTEALHGAPEPEFAFQLPGEVRPTTGQRHRWRDG